MKKVLFVGNANSFLIIELAKKLKERSPDFKIDILSEYPPIKSTEQNVFDKIHCIPRENFLAKLKFIKGFYIAFHLKRKLKTIEEYYDIAHVLYLSSSYRFLWNLIEKKSKKQVITVFGGDYYKSNWTMKLLMTKMVRKSNLISATNPATLQHFSSEFKVPLNKQRLVRFGLSILDAIDNTNHESIEQFKRTHGINPSKVLIACGYNHSKNQNIEQILNQLKEIGSSLNNCILCFQFQDLENKIARKTIAFCTKENFEYRIFKGYLSEIELANYRKAIDIMIQVQSSDSFSGAMQEHLYAGSKVITGSWLPYEILDKKGIDFFKIHDFKDLPTTLSKALVTPINQSKNKKIIAELSKWEHTLAEFEAMYS